MGNGAIPFSGAMVRALLAGRKTQTRRLVNPQPRDGFVACADMPDGSADPAGGHLIDRTELSTAKQPRPAFKAGQFAWVKEGWRLPDRFDKFSGVDALVELTANWGGPPMPIRYEADGGQSVTGTHTWGRLRIPRFMPRWASRMTVEVTALRYQRLRAITEAEAMAEGALLGDVIAGVFLGYSHTPARFAYFDTDPATGERLFHGVNARHAYRKLWESLHGDGSTGWQANPWVSVIELALIKKNIDQLDLGAP